MVSVVVLEETHEDEASEPIAQVMMTQALVRVGS